MAENQKSIDGIIEKLALIADGLEELFPEGTIAVALELKNNEFKKVQKWTLEETFGLLEILSKYICISLTWT